MSADITLTDLFEVEVLQRIQDAFSKMTGFAAIITDANGKPVTKGSNFTDFCSKYTRNSPLGCVRCEQCDKHGAEIALKVGASVTYYCHAGLTDFAAPIMAGDKMIGCFVGGQVLTEPPDITKLMQVASEIDVELINYLQAALKVKVLDKTEVEKTAYFLFTLTDILSSIAYHKYEMHQANIEIEKVANLKSDFLANMSHEIRTPMNGVIGMAELALREELNDTAKDYISQIKSSGKTLLTIINDILDFSKIESGKLSIVPTEYNPIDLINDIVPVIAARVNKGVEFIVDFNPDIPKVLYGDSIRIKQVITNLCNNAAKFTQSGQVLLSVDFKKVSTKTIDLKVSVQDTGIGIKKEDLSKLFQSFSQVDSKRNRNIEGTGLGLAISKQLVNLMNGEISVDSIYEKGSTFSFHLPQQIRDKDTCIALNPEDDFVVLSVINDERIHTSLQRCMERLSITYYECSSLNMLKEKIDDHTTFCFFEKETFTPEYIQFLREHTSINGLIISAFDSDDNYSMSNVHSIKKPFSTISLTSVFNNEESPEESANDLNLYTFIAPDAKVLVVDDNNINLTVAEGLICPTQIQIEKSNSGKDAIDKLSKVKYDLILMDHMMPELDGVETTHIIRRMYKEYDDVPIIALTANAVENAKEMFISEGMNDFIPKPIELPKLLAMLKKWLPAEKLQNATAMDLKHTSHKHSSISIEGLDTQAALALLGSEELFWSVLKDYFVAIPKKIAVIKEYEETEQIKNYTVEVHALKSASKQIGATHVSMLALELENAGNEKDLQTIHAKTNTLLYEYYTYYDILKPLFPELGIIQSESDENMTPLSDEQLLVICEQLTEAMNDLDMDKMSEACALFDEYTFNSEEGEILRRLHEAVDNIDVDCCEEIINEWKNTRGI